MCWLCNREIQEDELVDRHHAICKRYLKQQRLAQQHVIVPVHSTCHVVFHRRFDRPSWSWPTYVVAMSLINWGNGILARL